MLLGSNVGPPAKINKSSVLESRDSPSLLLQRFEVWARDIKVGDLPDPKDSNARLTHKKNAVEEEASS